LRIIPQDRKRAEIKENAELSEKFEQDEFGCWVEAQTNLDNAKMNPNPSVDYPGSKECIEKKQ
jgi:hypothetical protein